MRLRTGPFVILRTLEEFDGTLRMPVASRPTMSRHRHCRLRRSSMIEPDQIEFHEHVGRREGGPPGGPVGRSVAVRIGIVAGSAILFVVGAVAAMGASPAPSATTAAPGGDATPGTPVAPTTPFGGAMPNVGPMGDFGLDARGGFKLGRFGTSRSRPLTARTCRSRPTTAGRARSPSEARRPSRRPARPSRSAT